MASDDQASRKMMGEFYTLNGRPQVWNSLDYSARRLGKSVGMVAPYRLYRSIIPLSHAQQRDIAFIGITTTKANHIGAMVQAHWTADYFFDLLRPLPSEVKMREEISTHVTWSRHLFAPPHGTLANWIGPGWVDYHGRLCYDMQVPDIQGLFTIVTTQSYRLEEKRTLRDLKRGLMAPSKM